MSYAVHLIAILLIISLVASDDPFGTCDDPFIILKHTVASSDALRDCAMLYEIFPGIRDEGADKFNQGMCAYQCKLELPFTCFKLHAPQTSYDEGLLTVETLEKKVSSKWKHALGNGNDDDDDDEAVEYDAFFDTNIAFWVRSLDEYITHWQSSESELEYFGIEWQWSAETNADIEESKTVYSLLAHSPSSAAMFEFVSFERPSSELYSAVRWTTSELPRATFQLQRDRYPWQREDAATIVPIRISYAVADVDAMRDFYSNVLFATELYSAAVVEGADQAKTVFMGLRDTRIELQFVERAEGATYGSFTVKLLQDLLMETHESIMVSQYCGMDRWMDNHYAYSTWVIPGLLDNVYDALVERGIKYQVSISNYDRASVYGKAQLDKIGFDGEFTYGLWIIAPDGQSIQTHGLLSKSGIAKWASFSNPQWCLQECDYGLLPGTVDPSRVYVDDEEYDGDAAFFVAGLNGKRSAYYDIQYVVQVVLGAVCVSLMIGALHFLMSKCRRKKNGADDEYIAL